MNSINIYAELEGREKLAKYMFHGDIPKNVAIAFQSSVLHRTGSNQSNSTRFETLALLFHTTNSKTDGDTLKFRIAYLVQNQLSSLVRMEGSMFERKLNEMAVLYDYALENQWAFNEIYDNYPFPADLANTVSVQFQYLFTVIPCPFKMIFALITN